MVNRVALLLFAFALVSGVALSEGRRLSALDKAGVFWPTTAAAAASDAAAAAAAAVATPVAPMSEAPTTVPMTVAPTTAPTTNAPTTAPMSAAPVVSPIISTPVAEQPALVMAGKAAPISHSKGVVVNAPAPEVAYIYLPAKDCTQIIQMEPVKAYNVAYELAVNEGNAVPIAQSAGTAASAAAAAGGSAAAAAAAGSAAAAAAAGGSSDGN